MHAEGCKSIERTSQSERLPPFSLSEMRGATICPLPIDGLSRPYGADDPPNHLFDREIRGVDDRVAVVVPERRVSPRRVLLVPRLRLIQHCGKVRALSLGGQLLVPPLRPHLGPRPEEELV